MITGGCVSHISMRQMMGLLKQHERNLINGKMAIRLNK